MEGLTHKDRTHGKANHIVGVRNAVAPDLLAAIRSHEGLPHALVGIPEGFRKTTGQGANRLPDEIVVQGAARIKG